MRADVAELPFLSPELGGSPGGGFEGGGGGMVLGAGLIGRGGGASVSTGASEGAIDNDEDT
mgnify:CR=1 FL=1